MNLWATQAASNNETQKIHDNPKKSSPAIVFRSMLSDDEGDS
jgi:hypothetical protein